VSPVKYELTSYIPEDDILHSDRHENLKSYISHCTLTPRLIKTIEIQQLPCYVASYVHIA
jgi:hypothetical protein